MKARRGVWFGLVLLVATGMAHSACHVCDYREYAGFADLDVAPTEACPSAAEAGPRLVNTGPNGNSGIVSVNGEAVRSVGDTARQTCCYPSRWSDAAGEEIGDLCSLYIEISGAGDVGDPSACLTAAAERAFLESRPNGWGGFIDRADGGYFPDGDAGIIESLGPPHVTSVTPRVDHCTYPTTARTTADVCG